MPVSDAPFRPLRPVGSNEAEGNANPQFTVDRSGRRECEGVLVGDMASAIAARSRRRHHAPDGGGTRRFRKNVPEHEEPNRQTRTAVSA